MRTTVIKITNELPSGLSYSVDIPDNIDQDLAKYLFTMVLGTLAGVSNMSDPNDRRNILVDYILPLFSISDITIRRMSGKLLNAPDFSSIVDQFLQSISHKRDTEEPNA